MEYLSYVHPQQATSSELLALKQAILDIVNLPEEDPVPSALFHGDDQFASPYVKQVAVRSLVAFNAVGIFHALEDAKTLVEQDMWKAMTVKLVLREWRHFVHGRGHAIIEELPVRIPRELKDLVQHGRIADALRIVQEIRDISPALR